MRKIYRFLAVVLLALVAYGGLRAQTASTPFSYSKYEFASQSGALSTTTLFTPAAAGDYIIGVTAEFNSPCCSCPNPNQAVTPTIYWSDATASYSAGFPTIEAVTGAGTPYTYAIHSAASQPVQISATFSNGGSCTVYTYNLRVTAIGQ